MDNKAYEKYNAEHKPTNPTYKEVAAIDPFDGEHTYTEMVIEGVIAVILIYAIWQIIKPKSQKED